MTEAEIQRITDAVAAAEVPTSGEIVPVVVRRSDSYPDASLRISIVLALLAAFALHQLFPIWTTQEVLWVELAAVIVGLALGTIPSIQRWFVGPARLAEECQQHAVQAFHSLELSSSRDRTGILIFVSLLERRVIVLADRGISSRLPQETWNALVAKLLRRIREDSLADGLCEAVSECGALLAREFPARPDDANELPNRPVIED